MSAYGLRTLAANPIVVAIEAVRIGRKNDDVIDALGVDPLAVEVGRRQRDAEPGVRRLAPTGIADERQR